MTHIDHCTDIGFIDLFDQQQGLPDRGDKTVRARFFGLIFQNQLDFG